MANRSYLYSINFDISKREKQEDDIVLSLSEYKAYIPLAFQILVSQDSKMCRSLIWDCEYLVGIVGDYRKGMQKLFDFLTQLATEDLFDQTELLEHIETTKAFLSERQQDYILLECLELYQFLDEPVETQNTELFKNSIQDIDDVINDYMDYFKSFKASKIQLEEEIAELSKPRSTLKKLFYRKNNDDKIRTLQTKVAYYDEKMSSYLGIDYWREVLYFQFDKE
ncbi:hypothetical protein [Flavobacterium sp. JP2137]|uniref:DUF7822 domain-containing protein n=1 Tax=Flavobacterium sp. JP2137 TaxID=3414510 RepID=UPI003D2FDC7A